MSQYNSGGLDTAIQQGPRFLHHLLYKRATITGILARDFAHRIPEQVAALRPLVESGALLLPETIVDGFDALPRALQTMLEGANRGKMIVRATHQMEAAQTPEAPKKDLGADKAVQ